jgi:hypothetical protein
MKATENMWTSHFFCLFLMLLFTLIEPPFHALEKIYP